MKLLNPTELGVYRSILRIPNTSFWKIYTLRSADRRSAVLTSTTKSRLLVNIAESPYEVVVYSAEDFSILESNLYPRTGSSVEIEVNVDQVPCYVLIWTVGELQATMINYHVADTQVPVPIDTSETINYSFEKIDATMEYLESSTSKGDIFPRDKRIIGPFLIGHSFDFDLDIAESAVCIGYGLAPLVNWNLASDPVLKTLAVKMITAPGNHVEVGPLACRHYGVAE